jgi:flagellar protein FlaF
MTLQAYRNTQRITEDSRTAEYRLFGQVTGALIDVQKTGAAAAGPLVEAIDWNKKLWRTLAADCMDERNQLPQDLRAKIISLSLWIAKYSRQVTREGASLQPLIEVNRTIMQGLNGAA